MNRAWLYLGMAALAGVLVVFAWPLDRAPGDGPKPAHATAREAAAPPAPAAAEASNPAALEIDALRRRLDEESRARREIERQLAMLESEVADLRSGVERRLETAAESTADEAAAAGVPGRAWFDEQALIDSGMNEARVSELRLFFEQLELERLRLRDRAAREGWDRSARRAEFEILDAREDSLRARLGEEEYAAYLYASGRPNRVEVTSVLASAPAGQAGIRAGDRILRYANQRIYSPRELRAATAAGTFGDPVEIEVERDGESLQFYLARGPMGVRTDALSIAP